MNNSRSLLAFFFVALFLCNQIFCEVRQIFVEPVSQTVVPKNIYVGDKAEVRYSFKADVSFFSDTSTNARNKIQLVEIDLSNVGFEIDTNEYTIEKMQLEYNGSSYTLVVVMQAWSVGDVAIPLFDLAHALYGDDAAFSCAIGLAPVAVMSLVQSAEQSIRANVAPLLVPGTIYFVYGFIALAFIFFIALVIVAVKFSSVKTAWQNFLIQLRYKRNVRKTFAALKRLENDSSIDDKNFCSQLEDIARNYLSVRYGFSFASVVTSKMMPTLIELTADTLSEKNEEACESIVELFYRADHVRFGEGSVGYVALDSGERHLLVEKIRNAVMRFEDKTDV